MGLMARDAEVAFQDFTQLIYNCEPTNELMANTGGTGLGSSNTFERKFHLNFISAMYSGNTLMQLQGEFSGKLEIEAILCGGFGTDGTDDPGVVQYARLHAICVADADGDMQIASIECVEYKQSALAAYLPPMALSYDPGDGEDYPSIAVQDGQVNQSQTILVRVRAIGAADTTGSDLNLALNADDLGGGPSTYPIPLPVDQLYQNGSNGETIPALVKTYLITGDSTGIDSGVISLYLNPAASYKPGEIITIKDQGIINGGLLVAVYAYGGEDIESENDAATLNSPFDSISLMSDGVSNWIVVAANSTTILGDGPGCQPVDVQ